jgi:hypothetical protein
VRRRSAGSQLCRNEILQRDSKGVGGGLDFWRKYDYNDVFAIASKSVVWKRRVIVLALHGWQIIAGQNIVERYRMTRLLRKLSGGIAGEGSISVLFFALYYLYLWLVVDLRLVYHDGGAVMNFPVFYRGWDFFGRFTSYPGGLVDYTSMFFAQFFYVGLAGPLVATAQAWLLWLLASSITRIACGRSYKVVYFAFPILLLGYYAKYKYPFGVAMTVLAAMCFTRLYMSTSSKGGIVRLLVFSLLSVILYAIAGAGYLLFIMVCGLYELLFRRRSAMALAFLLGGLTITHIEGKAVFNWGTTSFFSYFMPGSYIENKAVFLLMCIYILYLLLPLTLVYLRIEPSLRGLWHRWTYRITAPFAGKFRVIPSPLVAIAVAAVVSFFCYNKALQTEIAASYYSCNGMWGKVLDITPRNSKITAVNYLADLALYKTGRLPQDMFRYGQHADILVVTNETVSNPVVWWRLFDTYIELGHMNMAERMLILAMDTYGERPLFLKRLALINMVKNNIGAARVYLKSLSRTMFDADWANAYLKKIECDPNLLTDEQIQHLRSIMPETDRDFKFLKEDFYQDLLARNRHNKMAFEYLAAYYLLTGGQPDKFMGLMSRLDDFDYSGIPRVYEEAILFYNFKTKRNFKVPGREISTESRKRFDGFCYVFLKQYGGNQGLALDELARNYGDSYLFYSLYGYSGMKK